MTIFRNSIAVLTALAGGLLLFGPLGRAADLSANWATNADSCKSVFVKDGNKVSFAENSDLHGSGFIIEQNEVRGKMAACRIRSQKTDGAVIHMILSCAGDALVGTVQLSLRVDNDNKITRIWPGVPELDTAYYRCPN